METVKEKLATLFNDYWGVTMTVEELVNVFVSNGVTLQDAKSLNEFLAPIDEYQGLKQKYLVFKADSGERVMDCFVLRPQKDLAAAEALRAYANATDNKVLADDIRNWIGEGESARKIQRLAGIISGDPNTSVNLEIRKNYRSVVKIDE